MGDEQMGVYNHQYYSKFNNQSEVELPSLQWSEICKQLNYLFSPGQRIRWAKQLTYGVELGKKMFRKEE